MKKSKLIVPAALAVMLLSTAASVTGTVAWFTANRAVTVDGSEFEVTTTDGNLRVNLSAVANCTVDDTNKKVTIAQTQTAGADTTSDDSDDVFENNIKLTDASVKLTAGSLLAANSYNDINTIATVYTNGDVFDSYGIPDEYIVSNPVEQTAGADTETTDDDVYAFSATPYATETTGIVLCIAWKLQFSYDFTSSQPAGTKASLFFDIEKSVFAEATSNKVGLEETGKGFRIGMVSSTKTLTWADLEVKANCNYVNSTSALVDPIVYPNPNATPSPIAGNLPTYTNSRVSVNASYNAYDLAAIDNSSSEKPILVDSTLGYTGSTNASHTVKFDRAGNDTSANHAKRGDYIGQFVKVSGKGTQETQILDLYCFAWFEGSDPYVVNAHELNTIAASMAFYTRAVSA